MKETTLKHDLHYVVQFLILILGFSYILFFQDRIFYRLAVCGVTLILYCAIAFFHQKIHHSLDKKIVLEYVLMSLLLFAAFFFSASSYL